MKTFFAAITTLLSGSLGLAAGEDNTLSQAWSEYSFQAWGQAQSLFSQVVSEHGHDSAKGIDARCGLAMIKQFNTKKPDMVGAREDYAALLQTHPAGKRYILLTSLYAECAWQTGDTNKATAAWQSLLDDYPKSLLTQEALLQRTLLHMKGVQDEATTEAIRYLITHMKRFPHATPETPGLHPVFLGIIGDYYLQSGKPKEARDAYMQALAITSPNTMSYSIYAGRLFQVARISEMDLNDTKTAGIYYRRLINETPNDGRFFFSLEKAAAYKTISADDVRALNRQGLTEEVIAELFNEDAQP